MHCDIRKMSKTASTGYGSRNASRNLRSRVRLGLWAASLVVAMAGPASADFVCNAKTKLVNVFLEPPVYRQNTSQVAPRVWSPADALEKPFDIVDTLPSGARVQDHALTENRAWVWISFRHTQTGLVGQGYIHVSKLSSIPCDTDPNDATRYVELKTYGQENGDYFEKGLDELDDLPLEGLRGAKRFETSMLSGAIRSSEMFAACQQPAKDYDPSKDPTVVDSTGEIRNVADELNPTIRDCSKLLAVNPNYVEALIVRGDMYHRFAKTSSRGIDNKSPKWAGDIKRRKESQAKALADWTRASHLLRKDLPGFQTALGDRLAPTGAAGYEVK